MILLDETGDFAIFSQSTDKSDAEIFSYLEDFGKSAGMLAYNEFYNTFYTIPKCLQNGDVFIGYSSAILDDSYARSKGYANWAKALVGHAQSSASFYNCILDKSWTASAFDILTTSKKNYIYDDMYANSDYTGKSPLKVNGQNGYFVSASYSNYKEVNFSTAGRHVMAIGARGTTREQLHIRASSFQDGDQLKENECEEKHFITFWASNDFTTDRLSSSAHAFVSFARENNARQMTEFDGGWGFYAQNRTQRTFEKGTATFGDVSKEIVTDMNEESSKHLEYSLLVSKEEYDKALKIKNDWSSKQNQLTVNDCISFVESVASSIGGLKVPRRSTIFNKLQLQSIDLGLVELPLPSPEHEKLIYFPSVFLSELIDTNKGSIRDLCSQ